MQETNEKESYNRIVTAADAVQKHLEKIYQYDLGQAKQWLLFTLAAGSLGFIALIALVIAMVNGASSTGIATISLNILADAFAIFFARQLIAANMQVLNDREKLSTVQEIFLAIELVQTTDSKLQDHYKGLIIVRLSGLLSNKQEVPVLDLLAKDYRKVQQPEEKTHPKSTFG